MASDFAQMQVAIPIFNRLTALDAIGPYEVLQRVPTLDVVFVGDQLGEIRTENGLLGLTVDATFSEIPRPDVIVVPGGIGTRALMSGGDLLEWLRAAHATTRWTTSVCTGSLVLAGAGLLDGLTATTHWSVRDLLAKYGAVPVADRIVTHPDKRIMMAAGVSAGIDMALQLVAELVDPVAAQAAQLLIEYDPQPPFDAGAAERVTPEVMARVQEYAARRE